MMSFVVALLFACGFSSLEGSVVSRPLTFKNSCPHNVRVGFTAGAIPGTTCSNCPQGGICNPNINMCFYSSPFGDGFLDLSSGENKEIKIEFNQGSLYSGAFFASTGCDTYKNACETGVCRDKVILDAYSLSLVMVIVQFVNRFAVHLLGRLVRTQERNSLSTVYSRISMIFL